MDIIKILTNPAQVVISGRPVLIDSKHCIPYKDEFTVSKYSNDSAFRSPPASNASVSPRRLSA